MGKQNDEIWRGKSPRPASWAATGILLVLAVAALAAYRGGTGFDVVRRYLRYGTPERAGGEILYDFPVSGKNRFAVLGEHLAVLSDTELKLADSAGGTLWSTAVHMANPALEEGGGRAVAYDVGGTELLVFDAGGILMPLTNPEEEPFLSARLNRNGCLAVTAGAQGRRGTVTVYGPSLELLFRFSSSRRFVSDAFVTDDNLRMAAVTLGQEDGVFATEMVLYRLDSEEPEAEYAIPDGIAVAAAQKGQILTTVTDTCLSFARADGTVLDGYSYEGEHLRGFALNGDGFTALLLNRYQSGSVGRLVTVDSQGRELGSLDLKEEVLSLSAAGKYVAALYSGRLVVYNQALREYAALSGTDNLRQVVVRPDGSILLIGADSARVFLP
ncbi:MAG: hypothetical protein IJT94_06290 [Oscillibacter sp.]|nr:hypothetical protein [Oscillibacter sp.]